MSGAPNPHFVASGLVDLPSFAFATYGNPAPQGSKKHVGNGRMVESSKKLKPWRLAVVRAAELNLTLSDWTITEGPVRVDLMFCFDRSKNHYRTGRYARLLRDDAPLWPANQATPDIDKTVRSTLDALVTAKVIADDSQVVELRASKRWAGEQDQSLPEPGAVITVRAL